MTNEEDERLEIHEVPMFAPIHRINAKRFAQQAVLVLPYLKNGRKVCENYMVYQVPEEADSLKSGIREVRLRFFWKKLSHGTLAQDDGKIVSTSPLVDLAETDVLYYQFSDYFDQLLRKLGEKEGRKIEESNNYKAFPIRRLIGKYDEYFGIDKNRLDQIFPALSKKAHNDWHIDKKPVGKGLVGKVRNKFPFSLFRPRAYCAITKASKQFLERVRPFSQIYTLDDLGLPELFGEKQNEGL